MSLETLKYLGIAFVGAWILIILAKIVLQHILRRPEGYYEERELAEEQAMLMACGMIAAESLADTEPIDETDTVAEETIADEPIIEVQMTDEPEAVDENPTITEEESADATQDAAEAEPTIRSAPVKALGPIEIAALYGIRVNASELKGVKVEITLR